MGEGRPKLRPDPRDLLDAISELQTQVFMLRVALDRIAQVVSQDQGLSPTTHREVDRIWRLARGEEPGERDG